MFLQSFEVRILMFLFFFLASCWMFFTVPNLENPQLIYFGMFGLMGTVILYVRFGQK